LKNLDYYLEDLENRINEEEEELLYQEWVSFAEGRNDCAPFVPKVRTPSPPCVEWPEIKINDALKDENLMILSQFKLCSDILKNGTSNIMSVRANYGVGIIPSMFGAKVFEMPYEANCLPNVYPLEGGWNSTVAFLDSDYPSFENGWGKHVISVGEKYMEIKERYPKIGRYVRIDHPDCQGPMDLCELLWGSEIFVQFYDNPEDMLNILKKITEFYRIFLDYWFSIVPNQDAYHSYFGRLHKGAIAIRDDSCMNLSPSIYEEFVFPFDQELLSYFNGGLIHFCGRGDHFIRKMSETKHLYGIDMSQPHLNNMEVILSNTVDKGIVLLTVKGDFCSEENLRKNNHRYSLLSII